MNIEWIAIAVPSEGPQLPEGWTFTGYSVMDENFSEAWPRYENDNRNNLIDAGRFYTYNGIETHSLVAACEHCNKDGCYNIYCVFKPDYDPGEDLYKWGEWINWNDGREFDFSLIA